MIFFSYFNKKKIISAQPFSILKKMLKNQKGFSLIELTVVLVLFVMVVGVAIDIFISMLNNQRRILQEQELLNQTSFATEYMSTALKSAVKDSTGSCLGSVGTVYLLTHCPNGTAQACNGVKFINPLEGNACEELYRDTALNPDNPPFMVAKNSLPAQPLLSSKFNVIYLRFIIDGDKTLHLAQASDSVQPKITFLLDIQTPLGIKQEKVIETTVSQRSANN